LKKNCRLIAITLLILLIFAASIYTMPVIIQEGNPIPVLFAIIKLELNLSEIATVSPTKYLQKTGSPEPLNMLLASKGWHFVDQLGAGHFYSRNGEKLFVMGRMFTSRYIVYELENPL
jgi:hypothetical protein